MSDSTKSLFKAYRHRFRVVYDWIDGCHRQLALAGKAARGHGMDHDTMVAGYTLAIAGRDDIVARQAWVAAMLHSLDRVYGQEEATVIVDQLLSQTEEEFSPGHKNAIVQALLRHDQPNDLEDSPVQIILMDADRLANMGPIHLVRSGQFRPDLQTVELEYLDIHTSNPDSTFKKPCSSLDNLRNVMQWETDPNFRLRTQRATDLAKPYFDFVREFFRLNRQQHEEAGLV